MRNISNVFSALLALLTVLIILSGSQSVLSQSADSDAEPVPFALPQSGPFTPADIKIGNDEAISNWFRSAHADAAAEAFRHWDAEEEIAPACATCHSGEGFRAFHGLDGSTPGVVESPVDVGGVVDCGTCHNAGLAEIKEVAFPSGLMHPVQGVEASCLTCHQGDSPEDIRISRQSYDGSGDTSKGIRSDIQANAALLLETVKTYAADVAGAPMVYDGTRYPYFFADANGDEVADVNEGRPVAYSGWTPRSLRAAYNWKLVTADPGNYALELLYDSIEDLSGPLGIDMDALDLLR